MQLNIPTRHNSIQMNLAVRELAASACFLYTGSHLTKEDDEMVGSHRLYGTGEHEDQYIDELSSGSVLHCHAHTLPARHIMRERCMAKLKPSYDPRRIAVQDMAALDVHDSSGLGACIVDSAKVTEYLTDLITMITMTPRAEAPIWVSLNLPTWSLCITGMGHLHRRCLRKALSASKPSLWSSF